MQDTRCIASFVAVLFITHLAFAAPDGWDVNEDGEHVVLLKDGSTFRGEIVESVPGKSLVLRLPTGDLRRLRGAEIVSVRAAEPASKPPTQPEPAPEDSVASSPPTSSGPVAAVTTNAVDDSYPTRALGDRGVVTISAERLFGYRKANLEVGDQEIETKEGNVLSGGTAVLAVDAFVTDGVSIGASVGYTDEDANPGDHTQSWFGSVRVGYFARVSERWGVWPQVGLRHTKADTADVEVTTTSFAGQLPIVVELVPHAAVTFGPTAATLLDGSAEAGSTKLDVTGTAYGFDFGLLLWL